MFTFDGVWAFNWNMHCIWNLLLNWVRSWHMNWDLDVFLHVNWNLINMTN